MPDGREVSPFWEGATNPDGTLKKKKAAPDEAKEKESSSGEAFCIKGRNA
jgi:hypothetical protein